MHLSGKGLKCVLLNIFTRDCVVKTHSIVSCVEDSSPSLTT